MSRVLITGIGGFTGRYLAAELATAGYDVSGTEISGTEISPTATPKLKTYQCDLRDAAAIKLALIEAKPDIVVHLAGIAFAMHGDVGGIYQANVVGTRNLLDAIASSGHAPKSVLLASSANVYGNTGSAMIEETTITAPANDYAVSKLAMEYMAKLWQDRLPITIVRPFNYTGVGQSTKFFIPKLVDHFKRRAHSVELGNLDVIRDFSDVRTVVQCYRRLIDVVSPGGIFNICSGEGHALREVIQILQELSGHELRITIAPALIRSDEALRTVGSREKLEGAIGPVRPIALRETLAWMLQYD